MKTCFQCGSNIASNSGVCQKCGYKNTIEKPVIAPSPPPVVNKPFIPPPLAAHNPGRISKAGKTTFEDIKSNSNSNRKIIFFSGTFLLAIIIGIFFFKKVIIGDYEKKSLDSIQSLPSSSENQSLDKKPTVQVNKSIPESHTVTAELNPERIVFSVENYLDAVSSQKWDRIDTLISSAEISLPNKGDKKAARKLNEEALAEIKNKNFGKAVEILSQAVAADESDLEARNNLGFAQTKLGDYASAKKTYIQTLSYSPTRSITWGNLAEIYANESHAELAYAALRVEVYLANDRNKVITSLQKIANSENPEVRNSKLSEIIRAHLNDLSSIPDRS